MEIYYGQHKAVLIGNEQHLALFDAVLAHAYSHIPCHCDRSVKFHAATS